MEITYELQSRAAARAIAGARQLRQHLRTAPFSRGRTNQPAVVRVRRFAAKRNGSRARAQAGEDSSVAARGTSRNGIADLGGVQGSACAVKDPSEVAGPKVRSKKMGALAWEQEPPKTHSVSRPFFDRGVGSSILASLSEAGGNDQHSSLSKPLPPRSQTCESRLSECVHVFLIVHAAGQSSAHLPSQDSLIFVDLPAKPLAFSRPHAVPKILFRESALPPRESFLSFQLNSRFICLTNHRKMKLSSRMTTHFRLGHASRAIHAPARQPDVRRKPGKPDPHPVLKQGDWNFLKMTDISH